MPGTNPNLISGWRSAASPDANALGGADGSAVSSAAGYAPAAPFIAPALKHNAINGLKAIAFTPGRALVQAMTADPSPPPGVLSGGAFPGGFSAIAVIKFNALAALPSPSGIPLRTFLGLSGTVRQPAEGGVTSGWAVISGSGKLQGHPRAAPWTSYWGWEPPYGPGVISTGSWAILGFRSNGQTLTLWRGRNVELVRTNSSFASGLTQFIDGLTLGADPAVPGWYDFDGEVARLDVFGRAISDAEYDAAFLWLADRYALPIRDINIPAVVGVGGRWMFLPLKDAASGAQANLSAQAPVAASTFSYKVNGGAPQTPAQVVATWAGFYNHPFIAACPLIALRLNEKATAGQAYTLTVAGNVIRTDLGYVDALTDGPVTNAIADGKILPWTLPATVTMDQGWNIAATYYWGSETSTINLHHGASYNPPGDFGGTAVVDGNGYLTNPQVTRRVLLRASSGDVTPGSSMVRFDYPGIELGRYVVSWAGADGSNLALVPGLTDNGQSSITPVPELDVLTGPRKKRYFDVAEAPGSIRKRIEMDLQYAAGVYAYDIDVRHVKYEGVTRKFADQILDRMAGFRSARFLDLIQVNASNISRAEDLAPIGQGSWALNITRSLPAITRIEAYGGPFPGPLADVRHLKLTFAAPHGIMAGSITIRSTDGNPVQVELAAVRPEDRVVNLKDVGAFVIRISDTELDFLLYSPGVGHAATVTPFTGSNAFASVYIESLAPVEAEAWLVNEADLPVCHTLLPHTLNPGGVAAWATRLANSLNPGKRVWLEISNEPWNQGFAQYVTFRGYSCVLSGNPNEANPMPGYCWRAVQMRDQFLAAWTAAGRSAADVTFYVGSQYNTWRFTQDAVDWLKANRPDITKIIVGIAPYAFPNCLSQAPGVDYGSMDAATIMDFVEADTLAVDHAAFTGQHKAILDASGLDAELHCYEAQQPGFGLSPRGPGANDREQWARHDLEHFLAFQHPRTYGVSMAYQKQLQAAGIVVSTIYGHTGGYNYEIGSVGTRNYGEYDGIVMAKAAKGDGSDGGPNNLTLIVDGSGNPRWPNSLPRAKPRGAAKQDWQAAFNAAGGGLTAAWDAVVTPRSTPIGSIGLTFSEPVTGVGVADVVLTRDGAAVSLAGAAFTGSGAGYALGGLSAATAPPGVYVLRLVAVGSGIESTTSPVAPKPLSADAVRVWTVAIPQNTPFIETPAIRELYGRPMRA